ncbi:MAG: hypothetical protein Q8919_08105 [Bacteroidota bacterium]|nr:hypothetical protein [Bacteroidota bacterium]
MRIKAAKNLLDAVFVIMGIAILIIITTIYQMPFRLDDVLHMDWARQHSFWDAFDVGRGEIVRSVRPVFAMTIWLLTHSAGVSHYFPWHVTLVGSFLIGLAYAGKTARYIANETSALYFTTGLFWLCFLPILNVLFWYGDLTFTLELLFVAPAWYYGIRGLLEGRLRDWIAANLCGILAVLAKEPALLLVHSVVLGVFLLCFAEIKLAWQGKSKSSKLIAVMAYVIFLAISTKLYFSSPTRSNRFFDFASLSHEQLLFFVKDRLSYYGENLLNPIARLLLVSPIIYSILRPLLNRRVSLIVLLGVLGISIVLAFLAIKTLIVFSAILVLCSILNLFRKRNNRVNRLLLPFYFSAILIMAVLLDTVMLVKTQLTELSFVLLIISGVHWSLMAKDIYAISEPYLQNRRIRRGLLLLAIAGTLAGAYVALPTVRAKEQLLQDVRNVRSNANDAIKWMGNNLPFGSTVLVATPGLYGLGGADEMTSKDDEYKLYAQYTFLQGYVRSYFNALHREDLKLGFLEDSTMLSRVLDSCRVQNNYYLFLQTGMDIDRFHGKIANKKQLEANDMMLAAFVQKPFPSEVWKLVR